jgi:hypothetical protein
VYLKQIFTNEELIKNKYETSPFVGFENSNILILIPEQTVHGNKTYDLCYYFKDNIHLLSIPSLLFVPNKYKQKANSWNTKKAFINKIKEIEENNKIINNKISKVLSLNKYSQFFKDKHKQIERSHQLCEHEQKKKEN